VKVEISVSEIVEVFKKYKSTREDFGDVRADMPKSSGEYLSDIMQIELTRFLGRKPMSEWKS